MKFKLSNIQPYWRILLALAGLSLILNLIAFSSSFCDWYADHLYPFLSGFFGRISGLLPFAATDFMLLLGIFAAAILPVFLILLLFLRKKPKYRRFTVVYCKTLLMILTCVVFIYTTHWLIPLRGSVLGKNVQAVQSFTVSEILDVRNAIVGELNEAAFQVQRGEKRKIVYPAREKTDAGVAEALHSLSNEFPRLEGNLPPLKQSMFSDVLEWMGIGGFTNPLIMEMIANKYHSPLYYPVLYAHEACHHKGYYKESEANFLSYAVLRNSSDPFLHYAGLLELYFTVDNQFQKSFEAAAQTLGKEELLALSQRVLNPDGIIYMDLNDSYTEAAAAYAEDSHPLESFSSAAEEIAEVGWDTQAAILQENNYDGDFVLIMDYYLSHPEQ